jgi:alpha-L-arabinofuranosidase
VSFPFLCHVRLTAITHYPWCERHDYVVVKDFIRKYNRYDSYPRNNTKIYALEYAVLAGDYVDPNSTSIFSPAEIHNRYVYPELRGSVAEFIYAMGMERNGDIVKGGAYAPLFHNVPLAANQLWIPDLISFSAFS